MNLSTNPEDYFSIDWARQKLKNFKCKNPLVSFPLQELRGRGVGTAISFIADRTKRQQGTLQTTPPLISTFASTHLTRKI